VDKRLEALGRSDLAGTAALANARAAYARYEEIFLGERFAALRAAGARVQRPLWASTGVKNPAYPETMYVDGLVAPDTVNTMPLKTLLAVAERGTIVPGTAQLDATPELSALAEAGIDIDDVTATLLDQGIAAFVAPMDKLLAGIESARQMVLTGRPAAIAAVIDGELSSVVAARVGRAVQERIARRVWAKDESLWGGPGIAEIGDRLGWLTISDAMQERADELVEFARGCAADGLTDAVLLGMGGSSLAPEVLWRTFGATDGALALHVLDSTDPAAILAVQETVDLDHTLFVVSTKSGGTIETLSLFAHFHSLVPDGSHFIAITDPGSSLLELAREHGFRASFENDPNIGGRYSALSLFGLVPAALIGAPVHALLERAVVAEQECAHFEQTQTNPGLWLGLAVGELARHGRDKLTFVVGDPTASFGLWVEQLVAESTGKHGRGILPVADEPLLEPESYGADRVFVHLRDGERVKRRHRCPDRRARPGRASDVHADGQRQRGPRAGCSSSPSSQPRSPAGSSRSTRSISPTSRRPRTPPSECSARARCRRRISPTTRHCAPCWTGDCRAATSLSWVISRRRSSSTRRSLRCAPR